MASSNPGFKPLSEMKVQLQKEYIEERRNEMTFSRAPGRGILISAMEASRLRGSRKALTGSETPLDLNVLDVQTSAKPSSPSRSPDQSPRHSQKSASASKWQSVRKTVTHMRRCIRVMKAFSRKQYFEARVQDNLARRHVYALAREILDDVFSARGVSHTISEIFKAIACATRQIILMRRVCDVLMAYLAERRARTKLAMLAQDHLKNPDWKAFSVSLSGLQEEMDSFRVQFDGMADIRIYSEIVQMIRCDISWQEECDHEAERMERRLEKVRMSGTAIKKQLEALHEAEQFIEASEHRVGQLQKILAFLGGCSGRRIASTYQSAGVVDQIETKIMSDVPEESLTKLRTMLENFGADDEETEDECRNELFKLGASREDSTMIISVIRREAVLERVDPIMQDFTAESRSRLQNINEHISTIRAEVMKDREPKRKHSISTGKRAPSSDVTKHSRRNAERMWDELVASFAPPTLCQEACRLNVALPSAVSFELDSVRIEVDRRRSVVVQARRRLSIVAGSALARHAERQASKSAHAERQASKSALTDSNLSSSPACFHPSMNAFHLEEADQEQHFDPSKNIQKKPNPVDVDESSTVGELQSDICCCGSQCSTGNVCKGNHDSDQSSTVCEDGRRNVVHSSEEIVDVSGGQCRSTRQVTIDTKEASNVCAPSESTGPIFRNYTDSFYDNFKSSSSQLEDARGQVVDINIVKNAADVAMPEKQADFFVVSSVNSEVAEAERVSSANARLPSLLESGVGASDHCFGGKFEVPTKADKNVPAEEQVCSECHEVPLVDISISESEEEVSNVFVDGGVDCAGGRWPNRYCSVKTLIASQLNLPRTPRSAGDMSSFRRRPCHVFKEKMNVESVMFDRNRRGHIHGHVLLDPLGHDERRIQKRISRLCS